MKNSSEGFKLAGNEDYGFYSLKQIKSFPQFLDNLYVVTNKYSSSFSFRLGKLKVCVRYGFNSTGH